MFFVLLCHVHSCVVVASVVFFFKQKTAYEMRISDWSSDVCSSDLLAALVGLCLAALAIGATMLTGNLMFDAAGTIAIGTLLIVVAVLVAIEEIGRASGRARVCQYV